MTQPTADGDFYAAADDEDEYDDEFDDEYDDEDDEEDLG